MVTFQRNIGLDFENFLIRINFLNDKNDTKCKNNDIVMLNNQKAEELQ